jgi:hypothetical protein
MAANPQRFPAVLEPTDTKPITKKKCQSSVMCDMSNNPKEVIPMPIIRTLRGPNLSIAHPTNGAEIPPTSVRTDEPANVTQAAHPNSEIRSFRNVFIP